MDYKTLYDVFQRNGCLKIENFLSLEEVEELKQGVAEVVDNIPKEGSHVFSVYASGKSDESDEYFLNSGDKIRYFFEKEAFSADGKLLMDKKEALHKVGYALHWWNPVFKKHTFSQKVKDLLKNFKYEDPVVVQSMIIFKKPIIGDVFNPHQDSTFLYTEPPTCLGLWFPLEDATEDSGCLWFIPGSHESNVHRRFIRNPKGYPKLLVEGKLPDFSNEQYIPAPAKRGDCIVIHGSVMHKSGRNITNKARTAYTYHVVEKAAQWSPANWLQPTKSLPFPSVYSN